MGSPTGAGTIQGLLLIFALLVGLFIAPKLAPCKFTVFSDTENQNSPLRSFPMDFPLTEISSRKKVTLRSLASRKAGMLVNFWASWCGPCIEELPSLEALSRQLKNSPDLPELVLVSEDEKIDDINQFVKTLSFPISTQSLFDDDGALSIQVKTEKFPETFWVEPNGNIRYKWIGPQDWMSEEVLRVFAADRRS